ncbi:MAG: hypothetical protein GWN02_32025 [Gemmatimonadetes bacterium]|nr:hypothetical protein [Gemmatimonadota bacterium]
MLLRIPLAAATTLLLLTAMPHRATTQSLPPSGFEEGEPFPHLVLPALEDGAPTSIADFRGQKLILHVFASW